jgi:hypothetical protein
LNPKRAQAARRDFSGQMKVLQCKRRLDKLSRLGIYENHVSADGPNGVINSITPLESAISPDWNGQPGFFDGLGSQRASMQEKGSV